ncbi:MAG: hydrogenobyrinic acid a,c-diamide synthase (glutamine-hydrolyzing) [Candidatus Bathyarchaeota archaeon]|nr:hydrogenobyrinic acid a,c-diamide synthase (glutamine-hydrolyzing) [Candidatus Bathyarchaeum tardum]
MNVPRVVIAGLYGEGGKTTVATGLMGALIKKGLNIQTFKSGPDHIDATYHNQVTNKQSRHLDAWLTSQRTVLESFQRTAKNVDIAVIEGAGGIFQGIPREIDGVKDFEGTAHIARLLRAPIVLVLDIGSLWMHRAEVIHAVMNIFKVLTKQINIKGIVINNVRDWQQEPWLKKAVGSATKIPILGMIPYNPNIVMPPRRGGLVPVPEQNGLKQTVADLIEHVSAHVEVDKIVEIAKQAKELPDIEPKVYPTTKRKQTVRIGVAFDEAFSCHNPDNLDLLEAYGAKIVFFSPVNDRELPENIDGLYFPGGFPDRITKKLSTNKNMLKKVKDAVYDEMPIYSEQGSSMYLTKSITDFEGSTFPMVGAISGKSVIGWKMQALDSSRMETIKDNLLTRKGSIIQGNDFRFFKIIDIPKDTKFAFKMRIGKGINGTNEGIMVSNLLAMVGLVYFAFDTKIAENFVNLAEKYHHK